VQARSPRHISAIIRIIAPEINLYKIDGHGDEPMPLWATERTPDLIPFLPAAPVQALQDLPAELIPGHMLRMTAEDPTKNGIYPERLDWQKAPGVIRAVQVPAIGRQQHAQLRR
jgi:hypothetical protein